MSLTADVLDEAIDNTLPDATDYATYDIDMPDADLLNMLVKSQDDNIEHWNKKPWDLQNTDKRNINYLLGQPEDQTITIQIDGEEFTNNRLFTSVRSILSYATGQVAQPEIGPSTSDKVQVSLARGLQMGLYEHAVAEDADELFRVALLSLITRKRAYLKMRYDPDAGVDGDIVTEFKPAEDITIDRFSSYNKDPNILYDRCRCTIDELIAMFPDKSVQILAHYSIKRGQYSQMSRMVVYYEAWFSYMKDGKKQQGLAHFLPNSNIILSKEKNPNWLYKGSAKTQKQKNVTNCPPKPYVDFSYFNLGNSPIDETCLFDQAVPLQRLINKRIKQITDNADYVNGRWVYNKKVIEEADAKRFTMAKSTNNALGADSDDVGKAIINIQSSQLPAYIYNSLIDARNELDTVMGTPSQFRGETPSSSDTLGRDQMVKQQAGMLQDDLVRAVNKAYKKYYTLKLQLMAVYYSEDHTFSQKGGDGSYLFFVVNGDNIDTNVKVGVQIDSTLPLDKASIRATALKLARLNRIDNLTLFEDLGMPDPEIRTERLSRSLLDPAGYMQSVSTDMDNTDAEQDIMQVTAGKTPDERSVYDENYLNYWNAFMTKNRFTMLPQDAKQRIVVFLQFIQQKAQAMQTLQATQTDNAGLLAFNPQPKQPNISITGALTPQEAAQVAGVQQPQPGAAAGGQAAPGQPVQLPTSVNPGQ